MYIDEVYLKTLRKVNRPGIKEFSESGDDTKLDILKFSLGCCSKSKFTAEYPLLLFSQIDFFHVYCEKSTVFSLFE